MFSNWVGRFTVNRLPNLTPFEKGYRSFARPIRTGSNLALEWKLYKKRRNERVMSSTIGTIFKVSTFGESHCQGVGAVVDGCPPGIELSETDIQPQLDRRSHGNPLSICHAHKNAVSGISTWVALRAGWYNSATGFGNERKVNRSILKFVKMN